MPFRSVNDAISVSDALTQLGAVMVANTALEAAGGAVLVNNTAPLYDANAVWPALLIEEDQTISLRQAVRTWKKSSLAICTYLDSYAQQGSTFDAIWDAVDLDLRRMIANLEDNPTITAGGVIYVERVVRVTFSPYGEKTVDNDTFSIPIVQRQALIEFELPAYISLR